MLTRGDALIFGGLPCVVGLPLTPAYCRPPTTLRADVPPVGSVLAGMTTGRRARGPLTVSDLPAHLRGVAGGRVEAAVGMTVAEVERRLIAATLEHAGGEKRRAAALLGIGLRTLYRKIREYGLG